MSINDRASCEASDECLHKQCWVCDSPLRSTKELKRDHPGAVEGNIYKRLCKFCRLKGHSHVIRTKDPKPDPHLIHDESHITLTDSQMTHVQQVDKATYNWHLARRKRLGIRKEL